MADEAASFLPAQEQQVALVDGSFLPNPDPGPMPRVPRNAEEIAAQLSLALDDARPKDWRTRYQELLGKVKQGEQDTLLSQVLDQELAGRVDASRQMALQYAQQGNAQATRFAAKVAADTEAGRIAAGAGKPPQSASSLSVARALETLGAEHAQRVYSNLLGYADNTERAAGDVAVRNIIAQEAAGLDISIWDMTKKFAFDLIPFADTVTTTRAINKVIGTDFLADQFGAITAMRNYLLGLQPDEQRVVIRALMDELGSNTAEKANVLRKLAELTKEEAFTDSSMQVLQAADVGVLIHGLASLVRRGSPLRAVRDAAGERQAGEMAAGDLVNNTSLSGLNDAEAVSRVIAGGRNPLEADPAAVTGLAAPAQAALARSWDNLLGQIKERLNSSGMTPEEVQTAAARIRASYMPDTNKRVFQVDFGPASENGQDMVVYWQGNDGRPFLTREAAQEWAESKGLANYRIVPKNVSEESVHASRGAQLRAADFDDQPLLLRDAGVEKLKGATPEKINAEFAKVLPDTDIQGDAIVDLFKTALARGRSDVSAEQVLEVLRTRMADEEVRFLAGVLQEQKGLQWDKVRVQLGGYRGIEKGGYAPASDRIRISSQNLDDPVLHLHEILHAHNSQIISMVKDFPNLAKKALNKEQIDAANSVIDLTRRLKTWANKSSLKEAEKFGGLQEELGSLALKQLERRALQNPEELITYGLTDDKMRHLLQTIKLSDLGYTGNEQTVLSYLWDLFKRVLGYRADDTALAKLTESFDKLVAQIGNRERRILNSAEQAGVLTRQDINLATVAPFRSTAEEWLIKQTRTDPLSYDAVGTFSKQDIESMPWIAIDPKHAASELALEARVVGVHAEAKTKKALSEFIEPYYKGLSADSKARVRQVLEEGDSFSNGGGSTGREWTYAEVRGKGLSEDEGLAYLATRQLRMAMYHIRNGELVRHLRAQGYKEIEFGSGFKVPGRVLSVDSAAGYVSRPLWDATVGKAVQLDSTQMANAYTAGKRIVSFAQPVKMDGELRQVMLVDNTVAKSKEIVTALHYRPGEYSRIYTDEYFITLTKRARVDGEMQDVVETVRTATSPREATEFVSRIGRAIHMINNSTGSAAAVNRRLEPLIAPYFSIDDFRAAHANGDFENATKIDYHFTRNKDEYLNGSVNEALANGRLFTSKRSDRLFSTDATRPNSLGVFESLEAEITNVSRVANIGQWRETQIRRWMNTFGDLLPKRTGNDVADFYEAAGATFSKGTQEALFAERTHKYIMRQIGLRTAEEQFYGNMTRRMTEKFFAGNEPIETAGAAIRKMGVLGFIRNINFNLTLGMFNPAQLLIQANGAATAMILSPVHGLGAAKTFPLLRMALMSENEKVWKFLGAADSLSSLGLKSVDEFVSLVKAVRQAGILDNLRSTALWNSEDGKLNIFNGYPSKVLGSHAFFFNRGEEFSRLVSFDVARREWMAANPGGDWTAPNVLKNIIVRMDDLTQNMTKANLARFQEGAASIPLQFAQYNLKLAANIMTSLAHGGSRSFTRMEAAQLLVGHVLLYGAAGNGLVALMDELLPEDVKESMPVAVKTYMAQGLIAGLLSQVGEWVTGERVNVALGSRLGSFDYWQKLGEALFTDPKNIYEALMGPTLGTAKRLGSIADVAYLWYRDPDLTARDVLDGLAKMSTEQVSTLRNGAKAYLYHQHANKMIDGKGVAIAQLTTPEVIAQALGFQPTAAVDVHNMIKSKKQHTEAINDIAALIYKVQKDIMTARMAGDHERADEQHKLLNALWPTNTGDLFEVQRLIRDRLFPYDSEFQRLNAEYIMKGMTYDKPTVVTQQPR